MSTAAAAEQKQNARKEFIGMVKSSRMNKSIVVEIVTPKPDMLYRKYVKSTKRIMAHDEENKAGVGDKVRITECRPLSKKKCWRLVEIVEKARGTGAIEATSGAVA
ncbi:MAG: 30S ribosomal protein S17 [Candidatus Hydrogenedentota bacterium]